MRLPSGSVKWPTTRPVGARRSRRPCANSKPPIPDEPKPDEFAQQEITECDGKLRRLAAANDLRNRGRRMADSIDLTVGLRCRHTLYGRGWPPTGCRLRLSAEGDELSMTVTLDRDVEAFVAAPRQLFINGQWADAASGKTFA